MNSEEKMLESICPGITRKGWDAFASHVAAELPLLLKCNEGLTELYYRLCEKVNKWGYKTKDGKLVLEKRHVTEYIEHVDKLLEYCFDNGIIETKDNEDEDYILKTLVTAGSETNMVPVYLVYETALALYACFRIDSDHCRDFLKVKNKIDDIDEKVDKQILEEAERDRKRDEVFTAYDVYFIGMRDRIKQS